MARVTIPTEFPLQRALLVGVGLRNGSDLLTMEESLIELAYLAETAGLNVVGSVTQKLKRPNPATFIGSGKVDELKTMLEETVAETVVFDDELSPRHQRELELCFGTAIRVIDRTTLILDIFARHTRTREGALQVELAQHVYRLPRLTRQWTHLARQAGGGAGRTGGLGGVGLHGPGEKQLEVDRREIGRRIAHLKTELESVRAHRTRQRKQRQRSSNMVVAIVGYTNAGKSTLLRALSESDVRVADQLFTTLDPTTRRVKLPDGRHVFLTDTVGFIHKLPASVVAAFRATLEEITHADLVLHVVDASHPNAVQQTLTCERTLAELEINAIPVLTCFNKIDLIRDGLIPDSLLNLGRDGISISARNRVGLDRFLIRLEETLSASMVDVELAIPYSEGHLLPIFHENGRAKKVEYGEKEMILTGKLTPRSVERFRGFLRLGG